MADLSRQLLTEENSYRALLDYYKENAHNLNMAKMFKADGNRFSKFRFDCMRELLLIDCNNVTLALVNCKVTLSLALRYVNTRS